MAGYDIERSLELAKIGCPATFCYPNAVRALRNRQRFVRHTVNLQGAKYVEGCVRRDDIIWQHGWLELEDGTILDPTYAALDTYGDITPGGMKVDPNPDARHKTVYYPLRRYDREELKGRRLNTFPIATSELVQQEKELR